LNALCFDNRLLLSSEYRVFFRLERGSHEDNCEWCIVGSANCVLFCAAAVGCLAAAAGGCLAAAASGGPRDRTQCSQLQAACTRVAGSLSAAVRCCLTPAADMSDAKGGETTAELERLADWVGLSDAVDASAASVAAATLAAAQLLRRSRVGLS
jgi:hypothetical protein